MAKSRPPIPQSLAAQVLFLSDRTCCVCRDASKPVQLHHIDEDPSNNDRSNLATLCLECHRDTQISGGFDRKLDADQIILYRDDWNRIVATRRAPSDERPLRSAKAPKGDSIQFATSVAEAYKERKEWVLLATHYNSIGNDRLRDKYIDIALSEDSRDGTVAFLRGIQGRPDLIPAEVVDRELARMSKVGSWEQRARLLMKLERYPEAAENYVRGIPESLEAGRSFSAAYYLREFFSHDLVTALYVDALQTAADEGDLWWQIRALEDLGWQDELKSLLLSNTSQIEESGDLMLSQMLAAARGESDRALAEQIEVWSNARYGIAGDDDLDERSDDRKDSS